MSQQIESPNQFYAKSEKPLALAQEEKRKRTGIFYSENRDILNIAFENISRALDRFNLHEDKKTQTAQEAIFLWTQAKLGQEDGMRDGNNIVSGYNLGAAASLHLKRTNISDFVFADGANRESDTIAITDVHAETSAIDRLKAIIDPLALPHQGKFIDMIVITNAAPCGSCRNEIYRHATSDQSLVSVIADDGSATVKTISELFPVKFDPYDLREISPDLLKIAREAAQSSFPSRYQQEGGLPLWGVVMETINHDIFQGHYCGDDAFWSNSPTIDAISNLLQWGIRHFPKKGENESEKTYKERIRTQSAEQIKRVVMHYEGKLPKIYPSGKERQQLSLLPEDTEIIIVEHNENEIKGFKTTRKDLLPGAFTA